MKKILFSFALLFTMAASFSSCVVNRDPHHDGRHNQHDDHHGDDHHDDRYH